MNKERKIPHCSKCNSTNIVSDACAEWDIESMQWVLLSTYDECACNDCGYEGYPEWKESNNA